MIRRFLQLQVIWLVHLFVEQVTISNYNCLSVSPFFWTVFTESSFKKRRMNISVFAICALSKQSKGQFRRTLFRESIAD